MTAPAPLDYEIRAKVNEALWVDIHLIMRMEGYTLSEFVREAIRRDLKARKQEVLASSASNKPSD